MVLQPLSFQTRHTAIVAAGVNPPPYSHGLSGRLSSNPHQITMLYDAFPATFPIVLFSFLRKSAQVFIHQQLTTKIAYFQSSLIKPNQA
jgi:hypothetical protein